MRIMIIALMIALLAVPAQARGRRGQAAAPVSPAEQQKKSLAEEKAYKDALKRIPDQKPADPWSKMR